MVATAKRYLFVINPKAGAGMAQAMDTWIVKHLPPGTDHEIVIWDNPKDFHGISQKLRSAHYTHAIAVGGDGTVNRVARSIVGTEVTLGILPIGSGNGLARSLGLPMSPEAALREILIGRSATIDSGLVNGIHFFCTSGVGFDARIGDLFSNSVKRGLRSYISLVIRELIAYRPVEYQLTWDHGEMRRRAFLITAANAGQYGNNFYIAPLASLQDGHFHVVLLKPFPALAAFSLLYFILRRKAHRSRYIETFETTSLKIRRPSDDNVHFDGEPSFQGPEVEFRILPRSLRVIVGSRFKDGQ